nr:DNA repair and recombination protein RAD54 isoform X3 [Arachis hypogaea]
MKMVLLQRLMRFTGIYLLSYRFQHHLRWRITQMLCSGFFLQISKWCCVPCGGVLIVLYETFRMHSSKFSSSGSRDLLICDEAHRLKNDQTITNRALAALPCKRRILFSGTPLQNDLEEFCGS